MVQFFTKYASTLTEKDVYLLSDKWVRPSKELKDQVRAKHKPHYAKVEMAHAVAYEEMRNHKNETLRKQEILKIAELYMGKIIYWPAVQDFRGRIYRIGHLNIQNDPFVRSLIRFYSEKYPVNRKKNSYTLKNLISY